MDAWTVSLIQLQSGPRKDENLEAATRYVAEAAEDAALVVLPEMFSTSYQVPHWPTAAESLTDGRTARLLSELARQHGVYLVGGSIPELADGKVYNTATLWSPSGELLLAHRKMHLFDIDIPGGITFFESDFLTAGDRVSVVDTPLGSIGLAIYVTANGKEVKTWKPFGWSGFLGILILVVAAFTAGDAPTYSRTTVEPLTTIVNVIGGLLLLGTLAFSMYLSINEKKKVSAWTPLVWGAVAGAVLLGAPF